MAQRVGPVNVNEEDDDGDLTIISVPTECIGFVTGGSPVVPATMPCMQTRDRFTPGRFF